MTKEERRIKYCKGIVSEEFLKTGIPRFKVAEPSDISKIDNILQALRQVPVKLEPDDTNEYEIYFS